jgi:hypothetical protein
MKACGVGLASAKMKEIEINHNGRGKPEAILSGTLKTLFPDFLFRAVHFPLHGLCRGVGHCLYFMM